MVLLPGQPQVLRLRSLRRAPGAEAIRTVVYAPSSGSGRSGTPTPLTLRIGETIEIDVLTRDEFGDTPSINSYTLASSNTSIFSVVRTSFDEEEGTAVATLTGLAPGSAKLTQVSDVAFTQPTPLEILDVTVLDASSFAIIQGAYSITNNPRAEVAFDELTQSIDFRGVDSETPIVSLVALPVDVRHAIGAAEPSYGIFNPQWSSLHGTVTFYNYGTANPLTLPALSVSMAVEFDLYLAIGGLETITVTGTNSLGQTVTGSATVRVRLAATVEASQAP